MSRIQNGPTMDRTESRQSYYLNQRNIVLNSNDRMREFGRMPIILKLHYQILIRIYKV